MKRNARVPIGSISILIFVFACLIMMLACKKEMKAHKYLDEDLPVDGPRLFAPSIVNTDAIEINAVFNTTFTELFFTRIVNKKFIIHHSELINGLWSKPAPIQLFEDQVLPSVAIDPSVSPDGNTLYFLGIHPEDYKNKSKPDVYSSSKVEGEWQLASRVNISTDEYAESYPVAVGDGSLYFQSDIPGSIGKRDIYRSQRVGEGHFDAPSNLGNTINSAETARSTYVPHDESFLIKVNNSMEDKGFDISFKNNDEWQEWQRVDLGYPLDKDWIYCCPYMSPDGKYFFYSRRYKLPDTKGWDGVVEGEVYWMESDKVLQKKE